MVLLARFTAGSAVKHIVLPGFIPRIRELFFSGFGLLAFYIAIIYGMAKLIPAGHPFLHEANMGKFGLRHVVKVAWRNLDFRWKNIDRIIFFFALIAGLLLMAAYIVGSFFFLMTAPAMASGNVSIGAFFTNPNPTNDIAFMMMDRMLGIPGIYDSKVVTTNQFGQMPTAFHHGLHALFAYFSWGLFAIAMVMLAYFIVDIVLETTMTGKPFGKRFSNVWIPLRIVAGLGLLIPVAYGLNSAQWITLYVAKAGSNFATNGWIAFNQNMLNPMGMDNPELVSLPVTPDFTGLAKDIFTIRSCKDIDQKLAIGRRKKTKTPDPTAQPGDIVVEAPSTKDVIDAYFVEGDRYFNILGQKSQVGKMWPSQYNSNFLNLYAEGLRFYKGRDIRIVFGRFNEKWLAEGKYPGGVEPVCGEVLIPNLLAAGQEIPSGNLQNSEIEEGVLIGASHMFAILNMTIGISKEGFADEGGDEVAYNHFLMKAATDRKYYQETSAGQAALETYIEEHAEDQPQSGDPNPKCINDNDNDGYDDDNFRIGSEITNFKELGECEGPIASEFYVKLAQTYQRYFSYGPLMGYDYYTGLGQTALNDRCSRLQCGQVVSGAADTCQRELDSCTAARDGYADYKPLSSVYYEDLGQENPFAVNRALKSGLFDFGWGGAGIWYKFIAEKNGALTGATNNLPRTTHYPMLMESAASEKAARDKAASAGCEKYNPATGGEGQLSLGKSVEDAPQLARLYHGLCTDLQDNEHMALAGSNSKLTGNPILDIINALFATKALYDFRDNEIVNPMSQLAALGRALIDKSILNIMTGAGGAGVGGLMQLFGGIAGGNAGAVGPFMQQMGAATAAFGKVMVSFSFVGLTAGILLFYVIPMLPFIYFFFAVGTWVKTVFEALVGVPLWALAHLRLDETPGFAGKAASGGYYMLLEIFIRPIVTVFSLVASMFIFISLAAMLNMTWGMVTSNLVGFDPITQASSDVMSTAYFRPKVDQFFFTIVYIIFMYITATGSFKLIDQIPDGILRWINEAKAWGVNDSADAQVQQLTTTVGLPAYSAISSITPQAVEVIHKVPSGIGGTMSDLSTMMRNISPPPKDPPS
ncbi:MAG: hypothetical protein DI586_05935 [Micavibrio aeruginosavorus]|uniref:Uncharacterized protein n=1 Tax=Micavibrio aeruginosavorus TaxID=349221 RepID=A0A2W5FKP3_9BACT|nr:MAG: hypothetical protein DI586_05935 [Micavibrio aeruginosavorus]